MLELYKNIRKRRLELGMSQEELARKAGYKNRSSIARIERGDTDLPRSKIFDIARALNTSASDLMGWEYDNLVINEDGEVQTASDLEPIEEEIVEKVKLLRPDFQRMALSLIENLIEMQKSAEL